MHICISSFHFWFNSCFFCECDIQIAIARISDTDANLNKMYKECINNNMYEDTHISYITGNCNKTYNFHCRSLLIT